MAPAASTDLRTADAFLRRGAWTEARRAFRRALSRRETPEALEGLGWAEWWLDRAVTSFDVRERAYQLYQQKGDHRAAARVAIAMAVDSFEYRGEPAVAQGWIDRARRLLRGHERTPEFGWAMLWQGHWARVVEHDARAAYRSGTKAAKLARALGLVDLEMLAAALQALALIDLGQTAEGMRRLDEAMAAALSGDMTALDAIGQTCCFLMHACERVCDYDRAVQWCRRVEVFCRRWRVKTLFTICRTHYASVLISHGAWREAERELRQACANANLRPGAAKAAWVQLAELRRRQGRPTEAKALLEKASGHRRAVLGQAELAFDAGNWTEAAELADRFARSVTGDIPMEVAAARELQVHALIAGNQVVAARAAFGLLRRVARSLDIPPMRALVASGRAALLAARGDAPVAARLYREARDLFSGARMPHESATAAERAKRVEERTVKADRSVDAATRAESLKSAPKLTTRERTVLGLVAQGLSDRVMASRLGLSEHTVHRHISNVLVKLDVPSRSAAVAVALRHQLI